ncbi:MAG: peptidylprolyl isomerase [Gammaproteobacteria bacterium]|nr:peptidylprolyl isomerase [Gammaproteobacteria bacterium]
MRILQVVLFLCVLQGVSGVIVAAPAADAAPPTAAAAEANKATATAGSKALDYIAIVNGEPVSMGEYVSALRRGMQQRFYHGKVPEEEIKQYRKEVAEGLVEKALLVQEAKRRKLQPDAEAVEQSVKAFDAKYQDNPDWQKARETVLPQVREKLNNESLAKVLEDRVRDVPAPTADELKRFYEDSKDLFTTPERVRVSLILLRVDPASTPEVWKQASDEAASIVERIGAGGDFAELARIHSSDKSAQNGGDMGFVHTGMLGENAQKVLDIMEVGEVSSPVVLLEGVSIFRLDEREKPSLNSLDAVKERAEQLYLRDKGEAAWKKLLADLRSAATIEMNDAPWR